MSNSPPTQPAADHGVDSQQAFKRKEHAYPVGPSWSPECDGSKLDLSGSFERPCYRVGPSTGASPALSSTKASPASPALARCRSPRSPGNTAHTPISDVETSRLKGPPWRALPAEFCPLKPPPVAKGWEVRMPPAPSTYVSPPMIFAERRPWKPGAEKGAGGSNVTPGFTFNVYRGCQ